MTIALYAIWIILVLAWFLLVSLIQRPIRKSRNIVLRIIVIITKFLIGGTMSYLCMVSDVGYYYWPSYVMAALHVVLMGDVVGDIISLFFLGKDKDQDDSQSLASLQMCLSAVCTFLLFIYGTVNMATVTANIITFTSPKLQRNYKVVFISDLHMGSAQSDRTVEKTVEMVKAEKPDFVLLGGDIVDEYTTKDEMEQVFLLLGSIDAPKFYVYGNHDRQPYQHLCGGYRYMPEDLDRALEVAGINALKDEWIQVTDDLVIFGREDFTSPDRKTLEEIPARPASSFVLMMDHIPYETDDIIASGAELQLSGHSHAGQMFPLQFIYRLFGYDAYGFFKHGDTTLYVSSGVSGWCFPLRTEEHCHYDVVTLTPGE